MFSDESNPFDKEAVITACNDVINFVNNETEINTKRLIEENRYYRPFFTPWKKKIRNDTEAFLAIPELEYQNEILCHQYLKKIAERVLSIAINVKGDTIWLTSKQYSNLVSWFQ